MGGSTSKDKEPKVKVAGARRPRKLSKRVVTSQKDPSVSEDSRFIRVLPLSARAWDCVYEEQVDRWRKSPVSSSFKTFPICTKKLSRDTSSVSKWSNSNCHDVIHDKARCVISHQSHGCLPRLNLRYDTNNLLRKLLEQTTLIGPVVTSGDYIGLHWTLRNLEDQKCGVLVLFSVTNDNIFYFFIHKQLESYTCRGIAVSPDSTIVCVLLSRTVGQAEVIEIQVYSMRPVAFDKEYQGATYELEFEVPGLHAVKGFPKLMFDPRFQSSRLGITNVDIVQSMRVTPYFMVYDLRRKRPIQHDVYYNERHMNNVELLDAGYSLDGAWVHALMATPIAETDTKHERRLWLIDSNTLKIVKIIELDVEMCDECYVNSLPAYSNCGRKMAVQHRKYINVYQLPAPTSLSSLCRSVLLANLKLDIDRLAAPKDIKDYLKFVARQR